MMHKSCRKVHLTLFFVCAVCVVCAVCAGSVTVWVVCAAYY